jgi:hypothetical protein
MAAANSAVDLSSAPDVETSSDIELTVREPSDGEQAEREGREQSVIPRADGGKDV